MILFTTRPSCAEKLDDIFVCHGYHHSRNFSRIYALPLRGFHGVVHWARVLENGQRLASETGANVDVVTLFALFHDSRRVNEDFDLGHGHRGARYARTLRGKLIHLDGADFKLLFEACRLHTDGLTDGDITLQTCWDADRLDLGRVGITPDPDQLCTDAAPTDRLGTRASLYGI